MVILLFFSVIPDSSHDTDCHQLQKLILTVVTKVLSYMCYKYMFNPIVISTMDRLSNLVTTILKCINMFSNQTSSYSDIKKNENVLWTVFNRKTNKYL